MKLFRLSEFILFAAEIIILIICTGGFYLITLKADLPFKTISKDSGLFISEDSEFQNGIYADAELLSIDGHKFNHWEEAEFYLDGKQIGDPVNIEISKNGTISSFNVQLKKYYHPDELIIIAFVGLIFFVMGVFVRIKASENNSAILFHWASLGLGAVIVVTAGYYNIDFFSYGYFNRIFWLFVYSLTPVLFIHFTSSFAQRKPAGIKFILRIFYSCAVFFTVILSYFFLNGALENDITYIRDYVNFFNLYFRLFVTVCIVAAISLCVYAYRLSSDRDERKRLQWLLLGFFIGPFSFALFWILPILTTGHSLVSESLMLIFLTAIPVTFSIAIVKYHLMDINLIVRRSIVYTAILTLIIITYIALSSLITFFVHDVNPAFPSILTAVASVIVLHPIRSGIQKFVDKKFFRVEYDFRQEQKKFLDDIRESPDIQTLAGRIVNQTDSLIPVDRIGFFILEKPDNRIRIIANKGWDLLKGRSIKFDEEKLKTDLSIPVAVSDEVEPGLKVESADVKVFKRWGMVLVFPVKSPTGTIHAFLALGKKKSETKFYKDDIDLLNTVSSAAALAIDRIKLQEELIQEQLKAKRLEELKELQSFFVSAITHELRTPLTAIKNFAELLQDKRILIQDKLFEYSKIIEGESDKLSTLIDNILDYRKIESGKEIYEMNCIEINSIIRQTAKSMQYQFSISKKKLKERILQDEIYIYGDSKAIELAVLNLLTNAIKYSEENSVTELYTYKENGYYCIAVKDEGKGIDKEQLPKIFEPFYRIKGESARGTGIGLAIVKNIMDAHNGKIEVVSQAGKGSTFTLWLPVANSGK